MELSKKLKAIRTKLCKSQREMGTLIGVTYGAINMYECNRRKPQYATRNAYLKLATEVKVALRPEDFL